MKIIQTPATPAEIGEAYPRRGRGGVVVGFYVINSRTGAQVAGPFPQPEQARPAAGEKVVCAPVFTPSGQIVKAAA